MDLAPNGILIVAKASDEFDCRPSLDWTNGIRRRFPVCIHFLLKFCSASSENSAFAFETVL